MGDDARSEPEPEPRSFAAFFCGEERFKEVTADFHGNSGPAVGYVEENRLFVLSPLDLDPFIFLRLDGIIGVIEEIEENLPDHRFIHFDCEIWRESGELELDSSRFELLGKEVSDVFEDLFDVSWLIDGEFVLSRKRSQVLYDFRNPHRRALDLGERLDQILASGIWRIEKPEGFLRFAQDDCKRVIDFVRDSMREIAKRGETGVTRSFGLDRTPRLLVPFLFCHVGGDKKNALFGRTPANGKSPQPEPLNFIVRAQNAEFSIEVLPKAVEETGEDSVTVIRKHIGHKTHKASGECFRRDSPNLFEVIAHAFDLSALGVENPKALADGRCEFRMKSRGLFRFKCRRFDELQIRLVQGRLLFRDHPR